MMGEDRERSSGIKSIRGIDERLYHELSLMARETGRTVGELVNEAMRLFLSATDKTSELGRHFIEGYKEVVKGRNYEVISGFEELEVTEGDLRGSVKPVEFRNIKTLVFKNVPYDLFKERVARVVLCDTLVVPKEYPKLEVAKKCFLVKRIKTLE
jgi:hypothetical protein